MTAFGARPPLLDSPARVALSSDSGRSALAAGPSQVAPKLSFNGMPIASRQGYGRAWKGRGMKRTLSNWCALIVVIGCNVVLAAAHALSGDGTIVIAALPAPEMSQAHVAAAIAYEETPRPEGLPDDMQPLPGVGLRFLSISAIDGFRIAAALWQPLAKPAATTTLLVQVHGSGGNLASLQLRATAHALSARGWLTERGL